MRLDRADNEVVEIALSERNLRTLLAKLSGHPQDSSFTILRQGTPTEALLIVRAEPDFFHYGLRGYGPGAMDELTERRIRDQVDAERKLLNPSDDSDDA